MVKDENRYLKEWLAFHMTQGFTKFYIYDNVSKVPVKETLWKEVESGLVDVKIWESEGMGKHHRAMGDCLKREDIQTTWISLTDTDEFIYGEEERLISFLERKEREGCPALKFLWKGFGSSGLEKRPEGLVIESFLMRGNQEDDRSIAVPGNAGKCVVRHGLVKRMANLHNPADVKYEIVREGFFINHYLTRSKEEFSEKCERGGGNGESRGPHLFKIYDKNLNRYRDEKILKWLDETKINLKIF